MALITFPNNPPIARITWTPPAATQVNRSEWTGRRRATILPFGGFWRCKVSLPMIMSEAELLPWRDFLLACDGQANPFHIVAVEGVQVPIAMSIVTAGGGQTGLALDVEGFSGEGQWMRAGMMVTVGGQLLVLGADVAADADGKATMQFRRRLRASPADGAPVEIHLPYAVMAMASDDLPWSAEPGQMYGLSFDCEEVF